MYTQLCDPFFRRAISVVIPGAAPEPIQGKVYSPKREAARRSAILDVMILFAFWCNEGNFGRAVFGIDGNAYNCIRIGFYAGGMQGYHKGGRVQIHEGNSMG